MYDLFRDIGRDIFVSGLISSHGGNISVRRGDEIVITRRGSMLGRLSEDDIIRTSLMPCEDDARCSRELVVHRAIYLATDALAIVHAHSVHTTFRSLTQEFIEPIDSEARYVLGAQVPVVSAEQTIASPEAAEVLSEALKHAPVAVLRSHGPFAIGQSLPEAFYHVSCLEAACHMLDLRDSVNTSSTTL